MTLAIELGLQYPCLISSRHMTVHQPIRRSLKRKRKNCRKNSKMRADAANKWAELRKPQHSINRRTGPRRRHQHVGRNSFIAPFFLSELVAIGLIPQEAQ